MEGYMKCGSPPTDLYMQPIPQATGYPYTQVVPMCSEWSPLFLGNVHADAHVPQYMSGITYPPHPGFNLPNEIHEVVPTRETNTRRHSRGRGMKRDNYNRMNPMTEISPGYMTDPTQYHSQMPLMYPMYIAPIDHPVPQQQPQVSSYYYSQQIHPTANAHIHPLTSYTTHPVQTNVRHIRHPPQILNQPAQESTKTIPKSSSSSSTHEKRSSNKPSSSTSSYHQPIEDDTNPSQINIDTRVIVNNSQLDTSTDPIDNDNPASRKSISNNNKVSPVNVKIEHNIVSTVNENCTGTEKNDVPCVNINSSIEVKQNGETDNEFKNETVSSIKTTLVKTLSKPPTTTTTTTTTTTSKTPDNNVTNDQIVDQVSEKDTNVLPPITTTTTTTVNKSWASVVKRENIESPSLVVPSKPTARINPLSSNSHADVIPSKTYYPKESDINESIDFQTVETEYNNQYDDPTVYRMAGKLLLLI